MIDKTAASIGEALKDIADGACVMIGGFGTAGIPNELIDGLIANADVPHHDRNEPKSSAGIAPGQSRRNADLLSVPDPCLSVDWCPMRCDLLNHRGPPGKSA